MPPIDRNSRAKELLKELFSVLEQDFAPKVQLSIVIPLFNEEETIPELVGRLSRTLETITTDYEVIFVDDGSSDRSADVVSSYRGSNQRIGLVRLARNFGHQAALSAGVDHARGEIVAIMDGDLQDPPEALPKLIGKLNEGFDVVYATRLKRKESLPMRIAYRLFYRTLRVFATIRIPLDAGDFCVMRRNVVDAVKALPERGRFLRGVRSWVGFKQCGVAVEREARAKGSSKYSIGRLVALALDGLVTFSVRPLRMISLFGAFISCASILLAVFYLLQKISVGLTPPGFATVVVLLCFLSGIQLVTIGLIGEYVGRIFDESKRRPLYVIRSLDSPRK